MSNGREVFVVGAGSVTAWGVQWRGIAAALQQNLIRPTPSKQLGLSHPDTLAYEVDALSEPADPALRRARMQMSRAAVLASVAARATLDDARFDSPHEDVGFFMGVGASGGSTTELTAMLQHSLGPDGLSLSRFGQEGLRACNPLFAFQLMNNFTLAHSAILYGTAGPNAAFFSRGCGTVTAMHEAMHAIRNDDCERALTGGADSALHPVTYAELLRQHSGASVIPGEGAALLALSAHPDNAVARLNECAVYNAPESIGAVFARIAPARRLAVVIASEDPSIREQIAFAARRSGVPTVIDITEALGESLAASAAIATVVALDLVVAGAYLEAFVLCHEANHGLGVVALSRKERE